MVEFNIVSVDMPVISDGPDDPSVRSFVADDCVISLVAVVAGAVVGVEVGDVVGALVGVVVGAVVGAVVGVVVGIMVGVVVGLVVGVVVGFVVVVVGIVDVLVFIGPGDPSVNSVVAENLVDVPLISLVGVADVMVLRCVCIVVIIIVTVFIKVENPSMVGVWVE